MEKDKLKKDSSKTTYKKYKVIDIPIYGSKFGISIFEKPEELKVFNIPQSILNEEEQENNELFCSCFTNLAYKEFDFVLLNFNINHSFRYVDYGIIVHEITHAKNHIFRRKGLYINEESEEAETYFMEYLMSTTMLLLEELKVLDKIKLYRTYVNNKK